MVFSNRKLWMGTKSRFLITGLTSILGSFQDTTLLWMNAPPQSRQVGHMLTGFRSNSTAMSENTKTRKVSSVARGKVVRSSRLSPMMSQSLDSTLLLPIICVSGLAKLPVASSTSRSSIAATTRAPLQINNVLRPSALSCIPMTISIVVRSFD
jgi:hypothetical protein